MTFSALHGAAAGALVTGAFVAFALRPPSLTPPAAPTTAPSLQMSAKAPNDDPLSERPRHTTTMVYVAGAVVHPGMYAVPNDARAFDAVTKAGGLTHDADPVAVNLAAHVADGDEIAVPHLGDPPAKAAPRSHAGSPKGSRRATHHRSPRRADAADDAAASTARVDLNAADEATLATVPGIGPTLAQRIVEFRAVNGRFTSVDGLLDVSGVSSSRFDAIASFLTVGPP